MNINVLEISELKWTGMGELHSDDRYIYYCGQESLRRNGVALIVNKRVQNAVFQFSLKNDRMISVCFPRQTIQHHSKQKSMSQPPWCQRSWSRPVLWRPARPSITNIKKRFLLLSFSHRGLEFKSRKSKDTQNNRQVWPWNIKWIRANTNTLVIVNTLFQWPKRWLYTWTSLEVNTEIRLIMSFVGKDGEFLCSPQKKDLELTVAQIMSSLLQIQA